jgi:HEAT repeat protein
MAAAADAPSRVNALSALGECGSPETFDLVTAGLRDALTPVRRAAAVAIVRIDAQRSIDPLIQALRTDDRTELEGLAAAIGQIGEPALDRSVAALSDPMLESGALLALESLPTGKAAPAIREYARTAVTRALHYHDLWRSMRPPNGDDRLRLLVESLQHAAQRHGTYALRAIGLLGDRQSMSVMIDNLKSRDPNQRANAIESLDSIGESHIVRPLLRLWEPAEAMPAAPPGGLLPVLQDTDAWLRACAALVAGGSPDPKVRSTLAQLAQADPDAVVREAAASALTGGTAMNTLPTLSLMERVLFLRRVPLFADMSPADLKHVAALAGESFYSDGETLARQGDTGSEMYIIVSGEVRVLLVQDRGPDVEVARRQPGEYVGEMAIISQEPRSASLVAAGDVRTLSIDQRQFEGILRERPETGLAVMRVLIARLKEVERGARLQAPTTTP